MSSRAVRSGMLTRKVGMTRLFGEDGKHIPVTVLELAQCRVVGHRTTERDGYCAVVLGAGVKREKRVSKPMRGVYRKAEVLPAVKLVEFRVDSDKLIDVGAQLKADHFTTGQKVDVRSRSIGKGFAGAMKRHNFGGLRATHGVSVSHRSHGSTGQCQDPGRVFKGKKMAGHMGDRTVTQQSLEVVRTDIDRGLILVRGAVPGADGAWVEIRDSIKGRPAENVPEIGSFITAEQLLSSQSSSDNDVSSAPAEDAADKTSNDTNELENSDTVGREV